jgi:hypothetical protein
MTTVALDHSPNDLAAAAGRSSTRGPRWAMLVLDVLFLATAAVFVYLAPAGSWTNEVMGVQLWRNSDPASGYVIGSLYLFTFKARMYVGHPGMSIQVVVGTLLRVVYEVQQVFGEKESFFDFWARNFRILHVLASLVMSGLHLISFHLLFNFARRVAGDAWVAFAAVLLYATSFPVLFYLMRISPEPMLVIGFLLTMLALWNVQEHIEAGAWRAAYAWTILAAIASVWAIYSKVHLAAPLPLVACAQLLLQRGSTSEPIRERLHRRLGLAAVFLATTGATFVAGMVKVRWRWFFRWWTQYAPGHTQVDVNRKYAVDLGPVKGMWVALTHNIGQYVPGMTPAGLFVIANGLFVLLAIVGLILYWRKNERFRRAIAWPLLYCIVVAPVVLYRGSWHYMFLHLALGAAPAAMLIRDLLQRWARVSPLRIAGATVVVAILLQGASVFFFIRGKVEDVRQYRAGPGRYYGALAKLEPGQRVAFTNHEDDVNDIVYALTSKWVGNAKELHQALVSRFREVEREEMLTPQFLQEHRIGPIIREPGKLRKGKGVLDEPE